MSYEHSWFVNARVKLKCLRKTLFQWHCVQLNLTYSEFDSTGTSDVRDRFIKAVKVSWLTEYAVWKFVHRIIVT